MRDRPARRLLLAAALASALVAVAVTSAASGASGHSGRRAEAGSILVGFHAVCRRRRRPTSWPTPTRSRQEVRPDSRRARLGRTGTTAQTIETEPRSTRRVRGAELHPPRGRRHPERSVLPRLWGLHNTGQTVNWTAERRMPTSTLPRRGRSPPAAPTSSSPSSTPASTRPIPTSRRTSGSTPARTGPGAGRTASTTTATATSTTGADGTANGDNNPDRRQRARHARLGHCCRTGNNGLGVAGVTWSSRIMPLKFLGADGSGTTDDAISAILYAREGRSDPEQLVGRRRRLAGAPRRDRADRRERRALRGRRGERLHEHGCRAVLSGELRRAERPRRRRERPVRPEGLVLELRRAHGRPLGAGDERLLDLARCDLSLRRRNLDGDAAGLGRRGAREGRVPGTRAASA